MCDVFGMKSFAIIQRNALGFLTSYAFSTGMEDPSRFLSCGLGKCSGYSVRNPAS